MKSEQGEFDEALELLESAKALRAIARPPPAGGEAGGGDADLD